MEGRDWMIDRYIDEYGKRLYFLCLKLERDQMKADELYQETWIRVLKGISSFDHHLAFYPWLTKVCVNTYRSMLKKRAFENLFFDFRTNEQKDYVLENIQYAEEEEVEREDLLEALKKMDYKKRLIVVLHYYEGYTIREIAELASVKEGTVKSRLHAAREELRRELGNE
jgi:RNA polymerase sigma-70 factor, ECF subfamily